MGTAVAPYCSAAMGTAAALEPHSSSSLLLSSASSSFAFFNFNTPHAAPLVADHPLPSSAPASSPPPRPLPACTNLYESNPWQVRVTAPTTMNQLAQCNELHDHSSHFALSEYNKQLEIATFSAPLIFSYFLLNPPQEQEQIPRICTKPTRCWCC